MSFIQAKGISKNYGNGAGVVHALADVSFEIATGEFVALMGESGAGKSTLLSILGAMNAPTSGQLVVDDMDIYTLHMEKRADFRREFLGFVFQSFHLIPYLTVLENVMLPLAVVNAPMRKKTENALSALSMVGIENKASRLPSQISGGEKERVAVARGIVNDPPILLADEPTGNLDSATTMEVMNLLKKLNEEGMTVIMVTHSRLCADFAERILTVSDGRLVGMN